MNCTALSFSAKDIGKKYKKYFIIKKFDYILLKYYIF